VSVQPAGAKDQVARLLTLVPFLHARGAVRLEDAAAALGVPAEQVLADLNVLLMCGLPGGYPDDLIDVDLDALEEPGGDGVIRVTNADYLARPLRLTPTEATAIIVALRALRGSAGEETREIVDRALAKLEAAAAHGSAVAQIDPGDTPGGPDVVRLEADLRAASASRRQVRLSYYVPSRDEQSERVVDPRGIVTAHGFTYLDAWCHSAEAPRLFRLDRIAEATVLETAIESEPEPPRDLAKEGFFPRSSEAVLATLELDREARWVVEYYPVQAVRRRRGGRLEVDLVVANEHWLQRLLLRLAPHARVLSPTAYAESFATAAGETLELYG
jgi:proteasome accessory factor C